MDIKSTGPNPPKPATAQERFIRPLGGLMHKLFVKNFVCEEILIVLLQTILSGKFKTYFGKEEANKLVAEKLASTFPSSKPEEMDSLEKWKNILNTIASSLVADLGYLQSCGALPPDDAIATKQDILIALKTLKSIEDWFYYHPENLKKIFGPGLLPKTHDPNRPFMVHKVLVVDDNKAFLDLCKDYLEERLGLALTLADPTNPKASILELIKSGKIHDYDLVIMDGNLPETSGTELVKLLRAEDFSGFILANSSMLRDQEEMLTAGADFRPPLFKSAVALNQFFFEI